MTNYEKEVSRYFSLLHFAMKKYFELRKYTHYIFPIVTVMVTDMSHKNFVSCSFMFSY